MFDPREPIRLRRQFDVSFEFFPPKTPRWKRLWADDSSASRR